MVADSCHWEKTFKIMKKLSKLRKNFQNWEKKFGFQKNVSESKKNIMKSRKKKIKIEKKYFGIQKNFSELRILLQNWEKCFRIEKYFVTRVYKKSWNQWPRIQWTSQVTFTCLKSTIETLKNSVKYVQR